MSTDDTLNPREERDSAAGEYVLGTLDAAARAAFERALAHDAALQAEVYAWQDRLLGLTARVAPAEPAVGLWAAIEASLTPPSAAAPANAVPASIPASAPLPMRTEPAANDALWRQLRRWQFVGGLGIAASVVLATMLALRGPAPNPPMAQAPAARFLAVLQAPGDNATGWVVEATAGGTLRLVPVATGAAVPSGKTLQFWTKAEGAAGPTSLGLVRVGQVVELPVSAMPTLGVRQLFELTLEPEAGSPIGKPTGPILFVGRTVQL